MARAGVQFPGALSRNKAGRQIGGRIMNQEARERYERAAESARGWVAEWRKSEYPPEPLGIGHELVSTVWLTVGGPTTYVEYNHANGRAVFVTTAYGRTGSEPAARVELDDADSQAVAEAFGLDYVEGLTIEPDGTISR